ncbi:MAG: ATP-binding protein [Actinomycetota bacterium]
MSSHENPRRLLALEGVREGSRPLVTGALIFRWVWLVWMAGLTAVGTEELVRLPLAWASIGAAAGWTMWLTVSRSSWNKGVMAFDIALCVWLILVSGLVVREDEIVLGRPFFATGYPLSAPLLWGAMWGPLTGGVTAIILAVAHLISRPLNGVPLSELTPGQVQNVTGAMLNYLVAGVAVGLVARLLQRSTEAVKRANEETLKERELTARLAERQSLARAIHDSVLQALALINKRGRELAGSAPIDPREVERLAEIAGKQEVELRTLILRDPEAPPTGRASLRDALEEVARNITTVSVDVSTTGVIWLERHVVDEIQAATKQALENVVEHAEARRATLFAEDEGDSVTVTVRDDGRGFDYSEVRLQSDGKVGILKSMKGRAEDLGGTMKVTTEPGRGTEVEFRIPKAGPQ